MDPLATYEALNTLREADDLTAPRLDAAWVAVARALSSIESQSRLGTAADRDDARQEAFLKVRRGVRELRADAPVAAVAWLRRVYERVLHDRFRAQQRRRALFAVHAESEDRAAWVEQLPAPRQEDPRVHDDAALAPFEEALFEAVDDHLVKSVRPAHRELARRKAELAYLKVVKREPVEALKALVPEGTKLDTLYQWTRRGRVQVLLPAALGWLETLPADSDERTFAEGLLRILRDADRADAGRPRPERRKKNDDPPVSPEGHWKSAQCDPDPDDEDADA